MLSHTIRTMIGIVTVSALMTAQTPTKGPLVRYTATTDNVKGAGDAVRIELLGWSTDAERDQLLSAWTMTGAFAPGARGGGARGGGGRGGGGGGGGRGGAPAPAAAPETPESSLLAALQAAPTKGYLWTSESTGYSVRYAFRLPQPDGGERIILATERRLGAWNDLWKPAGTATPSNYEFSIIELRLNSKGEGEGRSSLTGKVILDGEAKTLALEGYSALPIVFKGIKKVPS